MYFLSVDERRLLLRKLWPEARAAGVAEELRGWNWDKPPLSPIYEGKLSVEEVASQQCSSGLDLYLRRVLGTHRSWSERKGGLLPRIGREVITEAKGVIYESGPDCLGALAALAHGGKLNITHAPVQQARIKNDRVVAGGAPGILALAGVVSSGSEVSKALDAGEGSGRRDAYTGVGVSLGQIAGMRGIDKGGFATVGLVGSELGRGIGIGVGQADDGAVAQRAGYAGALVARRLREHMVRRVISAVEETLTRYPKIEADALVAAALPVMMQRRLDGSLLGLTKHLAVDVLVAGEPMPVVVKFGQRRDSHGLVLAGYALVMESLWECPVNLGCVAYVSLAKGRVVIERDFHVLGDELRQIFIEARDERTRIVEEEIDPGFCSECCNGCRLADGCR